MTNRIIKENGSNYVCGTGLINHQVNMNSHGEGRRFGGMAAANWQRELS